LFPSCRRKQPARGAAGIGGPAPVGITIQKILNDKGLGIRHERRLALERSHAEQVIELSPEQAAFLEKLNPCFKERRVESERPGQPVIRKTRRLRRQRGSS